MFISIDVHCGLIKLMLTQGCPVLMNYLFRLCIEMKLFVLVWFQLIDTLKDTHDSGAIAERSRLGLPKLKKILVSMHGNESAITICPSLVRFSLFSTNNVEKSRQFGKNSSLKFTFQNGVPKLSENVRKPARYSMPFE